VNRNSAIEQFYRRYIRCINERHADLGEFVQDTVVYNEKELTLLEYQNLITESVIAAPDIYFDMTILIADETHIAARMNFHCTPVDTFLGCKPTGRFVAVLGTCFLSTEGRKNLSSLVPHWCACRSMSAKRWNIADKPPAPANNLAAVAGLGSVNRYEYRITISPSMKRRLISSGSSFEQEIGFSRAVVQGDWVFVSGTTGFDYSAMTIADGVRAQTEQCLKNIEAALLQAGSSLKDVVRVRYVLPEGKEFPECWPVLRKYFGEVRPAATMISANLLDPRMRIEIEVTALKQASSGEGNSAA
jgi:enamine deaminase RidA (YjgF/YER057c/UK114 family)/predicted ester cyclase